MSFFVVNFFFIHSISYPLQNKQSFKLQLIEVKVLFRWSDFVWTLDLASHKFSSSQCFRCEQNGEREVRRKYCWKTSHKKGIHCDNKSFFSIFRIILHFKMNYVRSGWLWAANDEQNLLFLCPLEERININFPIERTYFIPIWLPQLQSAK